MIEHRVMNTEQKWRWAKDIDGIWHIVHFQYGRYVAYCMETRAFETYSYILMNAPHNAPKCADCLD